MDKRSIIICNSINDEHILTLKKASICGKITKGVKETLKIIEKNICKMVFLNSLSKDDEYKNCIREYCDVYGVKLVEVQDNLLIRDTINLGENSKQLINKAKLKGKDVKIKPLCNVVGIVEFGDVNNFYDSEDESDE